MLSQSRSLGLQEKARRPILKGFRIVSGSTRSRANRFRARRFWFCLCVYKCVFEQYYCKSNHFYNAPRMHSADYMPRQDVRLFVRASVCHTSPAPVFCLTVTHPQNFSPSGSPTIRFSAPNGMAILRRESPNGDVECKGV